MAKRKRTNWTKSRPSGREQNSGSYWIYGLHAAAAAMRNPARRLHRLVVADQNLLAGLPLPKSLPHEVLRRDQLGELLPAGAVHQGVALLADLLADIDIEDACAIDSQTERTIIVLDQVTDPRNAGAILRSAAAFEASALVLPERHSPPESGALAKAASGALEHVPVVRVGNLARALDQLAEMGYWRFGFDADTNEDAETQSLSGNIALVFGAEGAGLRRLTMERCDRLLRLPMTGAVASLNVATAAGIALYLARQSKATVALNK